MGGGVSSQRAVGVAAIGVALLLVVLRSFQVASLGPLLYSNEFAQLGNLAADLSSGQFDSNMGWRDFYRFYAYGDHAQGTLFVAVVAAMLAPLFGPTTTALHAVAILCEAAFAGAAIWAVGRRSLVAAALVSLVLLFPPYIVLAFQLMPYGNHTEFLALPVLLGVALTSQDGRRRVPLLVGLSAISVLLYRLNLAAVLAAGTAVLVSRRPGALKDAMSCGAGLILGFLLALILKGEGSGPAGLLPHLGLASSQSLLALEKAWTTWPGMGISGTRTVLTGLAALGSLILAIWGVVRERADLFKTYLVLWFLLAFGAPIVSGYARPEYLLNAWTALTLAGLSLPESAGTKMKTLGTLVAALLLSAGLGAGVRAAAAPPSAEYDGVLLHRNLRLETLDGDDVPFWMDLAATGRRHSAGVVTRIGPCNAQFGRSSDFTASDLRSSRCGTCSSEGVGPMLSEQLAADDGLDLTDIGAGLWIRCDRDMDEVGRLLEQLPVTYRARVGAGAEEENARHLR